MCGGGSIFRSIGNSLGDMARNVTFQNGWNGFRDNAETGATMLGNYLLPGSSLLTDHLVSNGAQNQINSPLGMIGNLGTGLVGAGVGSTYTGLPSAAESGAGWTNGANGLGGLFGDPTLGTDIGTGLSNAGNSISNNLAKFKDSSGLSSLFGGTPQDASALTESYNGINSGVGASSDLANSVATQGPSLSVNNALPSGGGGIGSLGGGTLSGGGIDPSIGESLFAPSSTSIGSDAGNGFASFGLDGNQLAPAATGSFTDGLGAAQSSPGLLQNLGLTSTSSFPGGFSTDLSGSPVGMSALATNSPAYADMASNIGGNNMSGLGSLWGSSAASAPAGTGSNLTNALLRGGLGYLLNSPNTSGTNAINSATQQAQANFAPYMAAGSGAEKTLADLYGNNGNEAQSGAFQNFQNTPGYQFALNQGLNAVNANAAAMGSPLSGNNQTAINNYAQGTANQTYNNYVNQLQNLASGGLTAAGGSGTAGLTGASATAQQGQNNANARNTAIGTGLSALFPSGMSLSQLLGNGNSANNYGGLLSLFG